MMQGQNVVITDQHKRIQSTYIKLGDFKRRIVSSGNKVVTAKFIQAIVVICDYRKDISLFGATLKFQNKNFVVYKGVNTIGRNKAAVINLKNMNVSQQHALIMIIDDTQHYISDLHSSNGTYLLGTKLTPLKLYELSNEAEVKFGDVVGTYFKVANLNTTVYLETENMEQTQNMTQNFYAATTQLMFDETNPKGFCNTSHYNSSSRETIDFHELATQVIEYPASVINRGMECIQENSNILIETVSNDFHEAPTQVVTFPLECPSKSSGGNNSRINNQQQNLQEVRTSAVILEKEKDSIGNEPKTSDEMRNSVPHANENSHDSSTQIYVLNKPTEETSNNKPESDDSFIAHQKGKDINVVEDSVIEDTVVEEISDNKITSNLSEDSNDSIDFLNTHKTSNAVMSQLHDTSKAAEDENSSSLDTQEIGKTKKRKARKLSSSQDTLQSQSRRICNSDSETDVEDADIINNSKIDMPAKNVLEIQIKNKPTESDSETDAENDLLRKSETNFNTVNNDSETDIDDDVPKNGRCTQSDDIVKPKILSKKNFLDSDSDTDIEEDKEKDATLMEPQDADATLNETDCIPATQDAFAEMFDYKNSKFPSSDRHSENVSSEESFKLGLTELMVETEENRTTDALNEEVKSNSPLLNRKESKITEGVLGSEISSTFKLTTNRKEEELPINEKGNNEDLYMMPTQEIVAKPGPSNQDDNRYLERTQAPLIRDTNEPTASGSTILTHADKKVDEVLSIMPEKNADQDLLNTFGEKDEDVYLMPTQQLTKNSTNDLINASSTNKKISVDEADEDFYMMPTQKISEVENMFKVPSKKFTFKKKEINLEGSLTNIFNNKEENYSPSKVNKVDEDKNDDDIYMQATQKLGENSEKITQQNNPIVEDHLTNDLYLQPTQDLNPSDTPKTKDTKLEEDLYIAATQPINQDPDNKEEDNIPTIQKEAGSSLFPKDPYNNETQKIDDELLVLMEEKDNHSKQNTNRLPPVPNEEARDNLYDLPTQPLYSSSETYDKSEIHTKQSVIKNGHNLRPSNPLAVILTSPNDDTNNRIKRPVDIDPNTPKRKRMKKSDLDNLQKTIQSQKKTDETETLSQIEAFVRKPLEHFEYKEANDRVETLSQIEAFIKQPLNNEKPKENEYRNTKNVQSTDQIKIVNQNETVTKQSLDKLPIPRAKRSLKSKVVTSYTEKEEDRPETLSQIETFIKQPFPCKEAKSKTLSTIEEVPSSSTSNQAIKDKEKICENNSHILEKSKQKVTRASLAKKSDKTIEENKQELSNISNRKSRYPKKDLNEEKKVKDKMETKQMDADNNTTLNNEHVAKTDVDVSFALLEAKSTKTRKSQRATNVGEIKIAVTKNRRSMTTSAVPESSKSEVIQAMPAARKLRRVTVNNNIVIESESKVTSKPKRKLDKNVISEVKPCTSVEMPSKKSKLNIETRSKHNADWNDDTDDFNMEKSKTRKETPSTSKARASSRITKSKNTDNINSYDKESSTSNDQSIVTKLNIETRSKHIADCNDDTDDFNMEKSKLGKETPSTSKARASSRITKSKNIDNINSYDKESSTSSDQFVATPRKGRRTNQIEHILSSPERSKRKQRPKVVFTMLDSPLLESLIRQLGGTVVDTVESSTVLVTERVKRSQKLLAAVGGGKPICSPNWIHESKKANEFLDPWDFILIDKEAESKWDFSLKQAITKATQEKLLQNYTFQLMVNTAADVLKGAIEACGGKCVTRHPGKNEGFFVIVTTPENRSKYLKLKKQHPGTIVVEAEAIFDGVLRQELRLGRHLLS